jgi:hypothetical protein
MLKKLTGGVYQIGKKNDRKGNFSERRWELLKSYVNKDVCKDKFDPNPYF